jgi:hypothetical protein
MRAWLYLALADSALLTTILFSSALSVARTGFLPIYSQLCFPLFLMLGFFLCKFLRK